MGDLMTFGSENAETDKLLFECCIEGQLIAKPILVGRWGTGKTATLLWNNKELSDTLCKINPDETRIWYLTEKDFDIGALLELKNNFSGDWQRLTRALEKMWKAEIIRRLCILLSRLRNQYDSPSGAHWDYVSKIGQKGNIGVSLWKHIPEAVGVIFGSKEKVDAMKHIHDGFIEVFQENTLSQVQRCLKEIKNYDIQPVIAIEPVETPGSPLEKENFDSHLEKEATLATCVIASLLNIFRTNFEPEGEGQFARIQIAVPWHRFDKERLDSPQKLFQYIEATKWNESSLREFINRRIEWEFKRVGRQLHGTDAWKALFDERVANDHCEPLIFEDSFQYILRHTHWRARDIQRITRFAVELYSDAKKVEIDEILIGRKGKISGSHVKETVRTITRQMTTDLVAEGNRRFPKLGKILSNLQGLTVPFSVSELKKRVTRIDSDMDVNMALSMLWSCGIIGVQIIAKDEIGFNRIKNMFGKEGFRQYKVNNRTFYSWSFFEYNLEGRAIELLERFEKCDYGQAGLVLHPVTFEILLPHVTREYPIGV